MKVNFCYRWFRNLTDANTTDLFCYTGMPWSVMTDALNQFMFGTGTWGNTCAKYTNVPVLDLLYIYAWL